MPLSLSVSFTLHTARLSFTHTKNTCTKEKVIVSTFTRAPSFLLLQPSSLSRRFTCSFFSGSFMLRLSSSVDCLPPSRHWTNTADRRWRRCHDRVACRPTNPSQSASQQAPSGLVSLTLSSVFECVHPCILWVVRLCVYRSVFPPCTLCVFQLYSTASPMIIYDYFSVCPLDWEEDLSITAFRKSHTLDWLTDRGSQRIGHQIQVCFEPACCSCCSSILCLISLSISINQYVCLVDQFTNKSILSFLLVKKSFTAVSKLSLTPPPPPLL